MFKDHNYFRFHADGDKGYALVKSTYPEFQHVSRKDDPDFFNNINKYLTEDTTCLFYKAYRAAQNNNELVFRPDP